MIQKAFAFLCLDWTIRFCPLLCLDAEHLGGSDEERLQSEKDLKEDNDKAHRGTEGQRYGFCIDSTKVDLFLGLIRMPSKAWLRRVSLKLHTMAVF